jgi:hypothetical protein
MINIGKCTSSGRQQVRFSTLILVTARAGRPRGSFARGRLAAHDQHREVHLIRAPTGALLHVDLGDRPRVAARG